MQHRALARYAPLRLFSEFEFHQFMTPSPFQPPGFDRLNQSNQDLIRAADRAWALHRKDFLEKCEDWVRSDVDEEIVAAKAPEVREKTCPPMEEAGSEEATHRWIGDTSGLQNTLSKFHYSQSSIKGDCRPGRRCDHDGACR